MLTFRPMLSHTPPMHIGHRWPFVELRDIGLTARQRLAGSLRQGWSLRRYLPAMRE